MTETGDKSSLFLRAAAIAALACAAAAPAIAVAGTSGGAAAPTAASSEPTDGSVTLSTRRSAYVGSTVTVRGSAPKAGGRTVSLQERSGSGPWVAVTALQAARDGSFRTSWKAPRAGRFDLRAVVEPRSGEARTSATPGSAPRSVTVYRPEVATWYGPGFYGNRTACGQRMSTKLLGVAHRTLPCGTRVALSYRGHRVVVPVVDRGPFANGANWDLTAATAQRLGFSETDRIGAAPLR